VGVHAVDLVALRRPAGKPVETRALGIVVRKAHHRVPVAGEIAGDTGGQRTFADAALGIQDHDRAHISSSKQALSGVLNPGLTWAVMSIAALTDEPIAAGAILTLI
jgi:hypothetical protein